MNPTNENRFYRWFRHTFGPDYERYEGVYRINIYLLRLLFFLVVVFIGRDSFTTILTHQGPWDPLHAVAYCVWAACAMLSLMGLFNPLKMVPIVLFEIFYKGIWLAIVAYPLWTSHQLVGSSAEQLTYAFLWLPLPLLATPWPYVFKNYFWFPRKRQDSAAYPQAVAATTVRNGMQA